MENEQTDGAASGKALKQNDYFQTSNVLSILDALKEHFGDEVLNVAEDTNNKNACAIFRNLDLKEEDRTIEKLIEVLWEPMREIGLQFTYKKEKNGFQMNCTFCPLAEYYRKLGAANWGYILHCACDASIVEGFSNKIGFSRSKTLMEGHDCCDHFYYTK